MNNVRVTILPYLESEGVEIEKFLDDCSPTASCSDPSIFDFRPGESVDWKEVGSYLVEIWVPGWSWRVLFKLLNDNMGSILSVRIRPGSLPLSVATNSEVLERNRKWRLQEVESLSRHSEDPPK